MIQLDERAIVYRSYKAAIKSIKSNGGDARRPIERYHQLKTRAKDNYQMKLSEQDVALLSKIYQLAIQYAENKLHDEKLADQIRELRDRYNEAAMQEGTLEDHPENCKDTSCVMCYPPVNALSNVLDGETREQRSKDMQEAINRETSARIGRAGCRGNDCD